eukprot:COSAG02_NODE_31727_length_528_cov_1.170163_1_plen_162_part_01
MILFNLGTWGTEVPLSSEMYYASTVLRYRYVVATRVTLAQRHAAAGGTGCAAAQRSFWIVESVLARTSLKRRAQTSAETCTRAWKHSQSYAAHHAADQHPGPAGPDDTIRMLNTGVLPRSFMKRWAPTFTETYTRAAEHLRVTQSVQPYHAADQRPPAGPDD